MIKKIIDEALTLIELMTIETDDKSIENDKKN